MMPLRVITLASLTLLLLATVVTDTAQASSVAFSTTDGMRRDTQFLVREMQGLHYTRKPLNQIDFVKFLDDYLESLDHNRLYFLESDIRQYHMRFAPEIIRGKLLRGDLYPAFQIFQDYRERALTRIDWVMDRLQRDFDFHTSDTYRIARSDEPWPASREEANQLWTHRLTYEMLNELLPGLTKQSDAEDSDADASPETDDTSPTTDVTPDEPDFEATIAEARHTLTRRYERWKKNLLEIEPSYIQESYLTTLTNLYDPHSTFLSADSLKDFSNAMKNSFVGIGAMLQDDDGLCTIRELLPGGPAEQSRLLKPGDIIIGVAQGDGEMVDVIDMNLRRVVKLIKGELGTEVRLRIRPADSMDPSVSRVISLIRDEVKLTANLASAELFQIPGEIRTHLIGVVELPSFYGGNGGQLSNPTTDVKELLGKLKKRGVEGIILDLRRNGGGLLDEAVGLTGLFIPRGPIVQIRDYAGNINSRADKDLETAWDGPLMVLVSRHSASASEIVAGALQNHNRAIIVGDTSTHGKGTVQAVVETNSRSLFPFSRRSEPAGAAKITIQKFYLPNGDSTQRLGVRSDIALPSINEHLPIGESDLENALIWDTIDPIDWDFTPGDPPRYVGINTELVDALFQQSKLRQESLPEFDYLHRSIENFRQIREREEFSLDLKARIARKKSERTLQKSMTDELGSLAELLAFDSDPILLDVRLEQEELSEQIQNEERSTREASRASAEEENAVASRTNAPEIADDLTEEDQTDIPRFDIHLREGLRIMGDWLTLRRASEPSQKKPALAVQASQGTTPRLSENEPAGMLQD